jgi:protein-S-isoprenylcysteine O-methyltransferase Ste14
MSMISPVTRLLLVAVTWLVWVAALVELRKSRRKRAVKVDPRARWGLVLETVGYFIVCSHGPEVWAQGIALWRAIAGCAVAAVSIVLFWKAVASLGSQWRFDAGLNEDHELVQDGAYRFVRHPIYASMFGMLVSLAFLIGTWPGWPVAIVLFIAGTEIRIRVEDGLLRERFGERFLAWRRSTPAYLPFVR